jgi:hypothetical protein
MHHLRHLPLIFILTGFIFVMNLPARAQSPSTALMLADEATSRWPAAQLAAQPGAADLLVAIDAAWYHSADARYFHYLHKAVDASLQPDGSSTLDDDRPLLLLYRVTLDARYLHAALTLAPQPVAAPASDGPSAAAAKILAALNAAQAAGVTVLMDAYYNSQQAPDPSGISGFFHYKWQERSDAGFSLVGQLFRDHGAHLATLAEAPTAENLGSAQIYFIVSPDNLSRNPHPNVMQEDQANVIAAWVRSGGVLVILANDPANTDLDHLNLLNDQFGIHFNSVLRNHVIGDNWEQGRVDVAAAGPIFRHPHTLYMKDVSTISVSGPAVAQLTKAGDIFMASAQYGKGTVLAVVDPWVYNEYADSRKLPALYDNYAGVAEVIRWLLDRTHPVTGNCTVHCAK